MPQNVYPDPEKVSYIKEYNESENNSTTTNVYPISVKVWTSFASVQVIWILIFLVIASFYVKGNDNIWCCRRENTHRHNTT